MRWRMRRELEKKKRWRRRGRERIQRGKKNSQERRRSENIPRCDMQCRDVNVIQIWFEMFVPSNF